MPLHSAAWLSCSFSLSASTTRPRRLRCANRWFFSAENLVQALRDLVDRNPVKEAAIISTCNRTEIYCDTAEPRQALRWLADYHQLKAQHLDPYVYQLPREHAVKHAFRVASGLDSMVLGEPQILGQMKDAVRAAGTGRHARPLLQPAVPALLRGRQGSALGNRDRRRTRIDGGRRGAACRAHLPSIAEQSVLFIGAGEMIELAATHFAARHPKRMTFANRTLERGSSWPSASRPRDQLDRPAGAAARSTTSSCPAPPACCRSSAWALVERALRARKHRPMFMVDLAVPRDIEPEVGALDDVFLYTVDDLGRMVREGSTSAEAAVAQAEAIIETQVGDFMHWLDNRELVPLIHALRDEPSARAATNSSARCATSCAATTRSRCSRRSHSAHPQIPARPTHALNHANDDDREHLVAMLRRLYQLKQSE